MTEPRTPLPQDWIEALPARHADDLTHAEVRRALQALSSLYVARRDRIRHGATLDGAGKRAAFAMFYGPLHARVVTHIVRELGADTPAPREIVDLGCGTGVGGAAWAYAAGGGASVAGVDLHPWAVREAGWTYRKFRLRGRARRGSLVEWPLPGRNGAVVAAYAVNELADPDRDRLLPRLLDAARRGSRILVVEPVARKPVPWWPSWAQAFGDAGGRDDAWRFPADLPDDVAELGQSAGLDHRTLTARSLFLDGNSAQ